MVDSARPPTGNPVVKTGTPSKYGITKYWSVNEVIGLYWVMVKAVGSGWKRRRQEKLA